MYYDDLTSLNIVVQQPLRVWKAFGDGATTTFSFNGLDVVVIEKVSVGGIEVFSYTANRGGGSRYVSITFDSIPAPGDQIRVVYSIGPGRSYNTWSSFGLVPKELPVWEAAKPKTIFTEIDGSSNYYDFTDFNNDVPGYKMLSGKFNFQFMNEDPSWNYRNENSKVMNALNGRDTYISYADQPNWRRRARLNLTVKPDKKWSQVTIGYDAAPYEEYAWSTSEEVPWDDLCFEDDPILNWSDEAINSGLTYSAAWHVLTWDSCWFTWDGPPTLLTFEHSMGYTYYASVKWRANPVEEEEGLPVSTHNTYDVQSGSINMTNYYRHSKLLLRPGQNGITFSVDWTGRSPTAPFDGYMRISAREARL